MSLNSRPKKNCQTPTNSAKLSGRQGSVPFPGGGRDGLLSVGILAKIGLLYNSPAIPHEGAMENNTHLWDSRRFK